MTLASRAVLAAAFALSFSSVASAEPTLWGRAREPRAYAEARLLESLERTLDAANRIGMLEMGLERQHARGAVAMFELSGISEPKDPRLAVVVAQALIEADMGREADARRLLERAIVSMPPGSRSAFAWRLLTLAIFRLDDPKAEYEAYTRVIEQTWDPESRANSYYNRGEVSMREHRVEHAREDYRLAVAGAREPALVALARYGLAVAEERLGDLLAAYVAFDRAAAVTLQVPPYAADDPLDLPSTAFIPPYEENYIRALRAMAAGRRLTDPSERRLAFEAAFTEWETYLARAPEDEPFRDNARSHRARVERELDALERVERRAPPRNAARPSPPKKTNP
jgi:tetratricopeptide (TPR) repeat protein